MLVVENNTYSTYTKEGYVGLIHELPYGN